MMPIDDQNEPGPENMTVVGRLKEGGLYRLTEKRNATVGGQRVITEFSLGFFRLLRFAKNVKTYQDMLIFHGEAGRNRGGIYIADPDWFVTRAELIEEAPAEEKKEPRPTATLEEPPASFEEAVAAAWLRGPPPPEPMPITPPPEGGKVAGWKKPPLSAEDAKQF